MFDVEFRMYHADLGEWDEWKFSRSYTTEKAMMIGIEQLNKQSVGKFEYRRKESGE